MQYVRRIGIDIGGVIIAGDTDAESTMFNDGYLSTPEMPGAIDAIARIARFDEVWIVSKCGPRIQSRSMEWPDHQDFWARTGLTPDRVRFCRKRSQKAPIAQGLDLNVFIDDRVEILASMPLGVQLLAFQAQDMSFASDPSRIVPVDSWSTVLSHLNR